MKNVLWVLLACCLSLNGFSKDDNEYTGRINSVQKKSSENDSGVDTEILKINTIQSGKTFDGVIRVSMRLEGKNGKVAWGSMERVHTSKRESDGQYKGYKATGAVRWEFEGCHGALKRPKLKAYTVEYGYREGGKFIVLEEDLYKTNSFEEFKEENKDALPLVLSGSYIYTVD